MNEKAEILTKENKEIPNEFVVQDQLAKQRKNIKTFEELTAFLKNVEENYGYGYGEAPRAMAQAALAVAWYLSSKFGITGFQAGFVMWDFITGWNRTGNECGLKLVDYDEMLYPQYDYKFEKTISSYAWNNLQKVAKKRLDEADNYVHPRVLEHWQSIADGKVPFGYVVCDD